MRNFDVLLIAAIGWSLLTVTAHAHETNACPWSPKTKLEAFEVKTGTVIVKGTIQIGTVTGKAGIVSVRCKEFTDTSTNLKEYGLAIEVKENDQLEDTTTIDYDELASLLNGID